MIPKPRWTPVCVLDLGEMEAWEMHPRHGNVESDAVFSKWFALTYGLL
jgi:hypothetical protein